MRRYMRERSNRRKNPTLGNLRRYMADNSGPLVFIGGSFNNPMACVAFHWFAFFFDIPGSAVAVLNRALGYNLRPFLFVCAKFSTFAARIFSLPLSSCFLSKSIVTENFGALSVPGIACALKRAEMKPEILAL